ncbi:MAG TPA: hypothetical protein VK983_04895, partial [Candidatus Limnocylindrales bacterium]|nr:hypothetical protein [Candidatus Limnocylindrales bacterium]
MMGTKLTWRQLLFFLVLVGGLTVSAKAMYAADAPSLWLSTASPQLTKTLELPANVLPPTGNIDCQNFTTRYAGTDIMHDACMIDMPLGMISEGEAVFTGSSESVGIVPPSPWIGLYALPGQPFTYTYSSASIHGLYMHFYRNIYSSLPSKPERVGDRLQYRLTKYPDFVLRDPAGKAMPVNPSAMAFS